MTIAKTRAIVSQTLHYIVFIICQFKLHYMLFAHIPERFVVSDLRKAERTANQSPSFSKKKNIMDGDGQSNKIIINFISQLRCQILHGLRFQNENYTSHFSFPRLHYGALWAYKYVIIIIDCTCIDDLQMHSVAQWLSINRSVESAHNNFFSFNCQTNNDADKLPIEKEEKRDPQDLN